MLRSRLTWLYFLAIVAGVSYVLAHPLGVTGPVQIGWKGSGVSLLALWAFLQARSVDGWLIALVLAFGAIGDVLLDAIGLTQGAIAFFLGHLVAIMLYRRNAREKVSASQIGAAATLFIATPVAAWCMPSDRILAGSVALYAAAIGLMAATAWLSRFPRYRVGIGAVLFVISDLFIFSEMGPLAHSAVPRAVIWPLYFGGQALIAWGVVTRLSPRAPHAA